MGVLAASIVYVGQLLTGDSTWNMMKGIGTLHWAESAGAEGLGFLMFLVVLFYMYWESKRVEE